MATATPPPPCAAPAASVLADRPGTGRQTSAGGSPCVVPTGEIVVESGLRTQRNEVSGSTQLWSGPLTLIRTGLAKNLEIALAPPANESRAVSGSPSFDTAQGVTDTVFAAKYLLMDVASAQLSLGASYSPPTGSGEFTSGAPTYAFSVNYGASITPRLSFTTTQAIGTAIGTDTDGLNRPFFVYAPSYTVGYALTAATTLLFQVALISRQGPTLDSGNRSFLAVQQAVGDRLAVDLEYEANLAPSTAARQRALGFGFVWTAVRQ